MKKEQKSIAVLDYIAASEALIEDFYKKYYWNEEDGKYEYHPDDWYAIGGYRDSSSGIVGIGDQFWDIEDIFTALLNDMDYWIVWRWYDEFIDQWNNKENKGKDGWVNLWHYWLQNKDDKKVDTSETEV